MRRAITATALSGVLLLGGAGPAFAVDQDGLVNVAIGDVTVLENVDVAVAATILANICVPIDVQNVNVLSAITAVDQGDASEFTCRQRGNGRTLAVTDA